MNLIGAWGEGCGLGSSLLADKVSLSQVCPLKGA